MKNIAVVFGGKSVEHDISIITALQVMKNLSKSYYLIPIYIKPNGEMVTANNLIYEKTYLNYKKYIKNEKNIIFFPASQYVGILNKNKIKDKIKIDCAVLCNHGHGGEDGSLQGLLEFSDIPYTSCSVTASAVCMDKVLTKVILKEADILTSSYVHFDKSEYMANRDEIINSITKKIKFPCIVKPARGGSSVGIGICEDKANLNKVIEEALIFDSKIIVEKFIINAREFCCAVMKSHGQFLASKVTEVKKGEFYTFEEKYLREKEDEKSQITKSIENRIKKLAKEVYGVLECDGIVRVDFLYDEKEELLVNEVNSIPGSLAFNMYDIPFKDLLNNLIREAIERKKQSAEIVYEFNSSAIEKYISLTGNLKTKV